MKNRISELFHLIQMHLQGEKLDLSRIEVLGDPISCINLILIRNPRISTLLRQFNNSKKKLSKCFKRIQRNFLLRNSAEISKKLFNNRE